MHHLDVLLLDACSILVDPVSFFSEIVYDKLHIYII